MHFKRVFFLISILIFIQACKDNPAPTALEDPTQPNILLIIADDFGVDACPGYSTGSTKPNMPHLESLMTDGLTFDNMWSYPICSPTRASIISGKYGYHSGVLNVDDAATLDPSELSLQAYIDRELGKKYEHSIVGKWHLGGGLNAPNDMGIDHYTGLIIGAVNDYTNWAHTTNGTRSTSNEYITSVLTNEAISWINDQDNPWFCWLAYTAPHTPFHLPPDSMHSQGNLPTDSASIASNPLPYFLAMAESMDHELGRLFNSMSQEELDNTVTIFIGDNGTAGQVIQAPFSSSQGKGTLALGGVHVPMVVSGNGVSRKGERESAQVNSTDLFPTIAQLCGINVSSYEDGISFYNLLSESKTHNRKFNYSEILNSTRPNRSGYTIRDDRYKLIINDNKLEQMFDLSIDLSESVDLLDGTLSSDQQKAYDLMKEELLRIRD